MRYTEQCRCAGDTTLKRQMLVLVASLAVALALQLVSVPAMAGAVIEDIIQNCLTTLTATDDGSAFTGDNPGCSLPFTLNFFGKEYNNLYVNNNGNVTFDGPQSTFTPFGLNSTNQKIIAPFFADVDTRGTTSDQVTFGNCTNSTFANGTACFAVNWIFVAHFNQTKDSPDTKLNTFQLVLVDLSEKTGHDGDFIIIFNYDTITWETGDASGGTDGLGGSSAHVGFSNGTGAPGTFFEFPGSGVPGSFLDGGSESLKNKSLNTFKSGSYAFSVTSGTVTQADLAITMTASPPHPQVGNDLTFNIVVTNNGPSTAFNVIVKDSLPTNVTVKAASLAGCTNSGGTVTCSLGLLDRNKSQSLAIVVTVTTAGPISNSAGVASDSLDGNLDNNVVGVNTNTATCLDNIFASESPKSVEYKSHKHTVKKTLKQTILNANTAPITIIAITANGDQPFNIESIKPALPFTITGGKGKTFSVKTFRAGSLPDATAQKPYFVIRLSCGGAPASVRSVPVPSNSDTLHLEDDDQLRVTIGHSSAESVRWQLFDLSGRKLMDRSSEGSALSLPVKTDQGTLLPNGVYLYVVNVRGYDGKLVRSEMRKLVIRR